MLYLDSLEIVLDRDLKDTETTIWKGNSFELVYETLNKQSHKVHLTVGTYDIFIPKYNTDDNFCLLGSENSERKSIPSHQGIKFKQENTVQASLNVNLSKQKIL